MTRGRSPVDLAIAWVDAATHSLESEEAALEEAAGRVLAADLRAPRPIPLCDLAAIDGFAVAAQQSLGAGVYNPLDLPAVAVAAGDILPEEADAVVPLAPGQCEKAGRVTLVEAIAAGDNVDRAGAVAVADALLVSAGTLLGPRHIGLIAAAGLAFVPVVRRPQVRLVLAGAIPPGGRDDIDGPMLRAAIARDGGLVVAASPADAFAAAADIVLIVGGTGFGRNDRAAELLADAGEIEIHGLALSPGETAGFGRTLSGMPVLLVPGTPAACLWSYELFAGRAIRRLGGRDHRLPYRCRAMTTARKIVSALGLTEICAIRRRPDGLVEPIASFGEIGLMAAAGADGFVIVPEASEGHPQGSSVMVHLYDDCCGIGIVAAPAEARS